MSHGLSPRASNESNVSQPANGMDDARDTRPWFRQFWPWFLILLPASAVIGGITTVIIAINNADDVVADSWYRDGRAINRDMSQEALARRLGIRAVVQPAGEQMQLIVSSEQPFPLPGQLTLYLRHPTQAQLDLQFVLLQQDSDHYVVSAAIPDGRWSVTLVPDVGNWRLQQDNVQALDGQLQLEGAP